jgi:hypothetical protein
MKRRSLQLLRSLLPVLFAIGAVSVFAQPPGNDKCADAFVLDVAASKAVCNPQEGDTRNTIDGNLDNIPACSVNFKRDDVWYKFVAPDAENGWTIEFEFGTKDSDINRVGFAIYASCDATPANQPLFCAVEKADRQLLVDVCPALTPGTEYLLRVWSAEGLDPNWQEGWGTFRICAYENDPIVGEVIWGDNSGEGDFAGGINDWTAVGISCFGGNAANANWVWGPIGSALSGAYATGQVLGSKTYCNGAMVFNSDFLDNNGVAGAFGSGPCPAPQEGALVSPLIDISAFSAENVSLEFHQNLRQFQSRYYVGYSLDGGQNWIDVEINQEFPVNSNHINEVKRVPMPGAAGAANLRVRFRVEANYYYWVIDDVRIIERERDNMRLNDFKAIAPNAIWHFDQFTSFPALVDVENIGAGAQTGVMVDYTIRNSAGDVVYNATKDFGTMASDSLAENVPFDECVVLPADLPLGLYVGTYTVSSDNPDFDPSNNSQSFAFVVDNVRMSKEFLLQGSAYSGLRPSANLSYTMGNYYYIVNGDEYEVCQIELGLSNANALTPSALGTQAFVVVSLYEWNDLNNDGDAQFNTGELLPVGVAELAFQDGDPASTIFTLDMLETTNFEGCVRLRDNTAYILAMEYTVPPGLDAPLFMLMSRDFNYSATRFATHPAFLDLCEPQYGEFIAVGSGASQLNNGAFNSGEVPVLRLLLTGDTSVDEPENTIAQQVTMSILPNPVSDVLRVDFGFAVTYEQVNLRVTDITGRMIFSENIAGMEQTSWTRNVSHLANGTYMITVTTPNGVTTERFMVQR